MNSAYSDYINNNSNYNYDPQQNPYSQDYNQPLSMDNNIASSSMFKYSQQHYKNENENKTPEIME